MKKIIVLVAVFVCSISAFGQRKNSRQNIQTNTANQSKSTDSSQTLPIKRVILYSNGVAYIERRGFITGNAEVDFSFKQSQVDDVLKSMIVLDLGKGKIGSVSYNSSQPVTAQTADIPFSVDSKTENSGENEGGIAEVLSQLQGANVLVTSNKATATGSILTVEKRNLPAEKDKPASVLHFLVIASETGEISSFDLNEVRSVKILDDETRRDINEFKTAVSSARRRDAKTITVTSDGIGQREMIVSYTIAAPIWKTTYRVVLDEQGKPFFQGWAIVDNVSDENWENVQLSLVSGSPVSFIQNLQKPLYRYRPVVPIPEDLNLEPQLYEPDMFIVEKNYELRQSNGIGQGSGIGGGSGSGRGNGIGPQAVTTSMSEALLSENSGVQTAAIGAQFGDLFEYRIEQAVSVPKNRSALIPIIQTKMEGERVSIFRENEDSDDDEEETTPRPMSGMLLKNTTSLTFEGGSMTIIDGNAYAGEALMERLKPKENRLISFALDLGTLINIKNEEDREPAKLVKAVEGSFEVHYFKTDKKIYQLQNQTDKLRYVYIEHPITEGWKLSDSTPKPDETTQNFYRFRVELPPFERKDLVVTEVQGLKDSYRLASITYKDLDLFIKQNYINEPTRAKLARLIELRSEIFQIDENLKKLDKEIGEISADQKRLRENIEALAKTSEAKQLITRYVQIANEQETRLQEINKERKSLTNEKEQKEKQLAVEIKNFDIK
jgi:hypothetical protein